MHNKVIIFRIVNLRFGRCESLEDMWIAGKFDTKQIKCSNFARKEVEKLSLKGKATREASFFATDAYVYVTFLNSRSLRKHHEDISNDEELMKSNVMGIAETHLYDGETVELEGFEANLVNDGKGKGVAAFSKMSPINVTKIKKENFSAIFLTFGDYRIVYIYVSKGANIEEIKTEIVPLLQDKSKPTIVMGDMNYDYQEAKHPLKYLFSEIDYIQMVEKVTHDEGNLLDHIYISSPNVLSKEDIYLKPLYFSDHDALCIRIVTKDK